MVLSIVCCNCDEGAWLLPVLALLAPLAFSALSQSSNSYLCLFCFLKLVANFPFTILPHCVWPSWTKHLLVFFIVGKILPNIACGVLSQLLLSEILSLVLDYLHAHYQTCQLQVGVASFTFNIFHDVFKGKVLIIIVLVITSMVMVLLFSYSYKFSSSYSCSTITNLH